MKIEKALKPKIIITMHTYGHFKIVFVTVLLFLRYLKTSHFDMVFFNRDFWANGSSVVGVYGAGMGRNNIDESNDLFKYEKIACQG
jgi:hypothetical protein